MFREGPLFQPRPATRSSLQSWGLSSRCPDTGCSLASGQKAAPWSHPLATLVPSAPGAAAPNHSSPPPLPPTRNPAPGKSSLGREVLPCPSGSRERAGPPGQVEAAHFLHPSEPFSSEGAVGARKALAQLGCGMQPGREKGLVYPKARDGGMERELGVGAMRAFPAQGTTGAQAGCGSGQSLAG